MHWRCKAALLMPVPAGRAVTLNWQYCLFVMCCPLTGQQVAEYCLHDVQLAEQAQFGLDLTSLILVMAGPQGGGHLSESDLRLLVDCSQLIRTSAAWWPPSDGKH